MLPGVSASLVQMESLQTNASMISFRRSRAENLEILEKLGGALERDIEERFDLNEAKLVDQIIGNEEKLQSSKLVTEVFGHLDALEEGR